MNNRLNILAAQVKEAVKFAPALAARLKEVGLEPGGMAVPGTLDRLPVLGKPELMKLQAEKPPFAGYLSCDMNEVAHVFASPGPIFEPVLQDNPAYGFDLMFRAGGVVSDDIVLNTWSYHLVPAGLLFDAAARMAGATVIPSGPGQTDLQVQLIANMGVTTFLGSTAYFEKVARVFAENFGSTNGLWPIKRAFLGGEPGDWMAKRKRLEKAHGISTHSCYGTADLGLVGFEETDLAGYTCHPERLVQICDPATGATLPVGTSGQIVVTTLARGWPMIRFGTGDLARALASSDDGFSSRISGIEGRVGDGVKVREIFLYAAHAAALITRLGSVNDARIKVWNEGDIERISLELTGDRCSETEVREAFSQNTRLRADYIDWPLKPTISQPLEDVRYF